MAAGILLACAGAMLAQDCATLKQREQQPVTIWVLTKAAPVGPGIDISTYREQTAGSFGTPSSNVGTAASNHGQAPSTLGRSASDAGTASSNVGQTSGSFGTAASNVGVAASDAGQTAGSFGDSLSTIADAGNRTTPPGAPTGPNALPKAAAPQRPPDALRLAIEKELRLPGATSSRVTYVEVPEDKWRERLQQVERFGAAGRQYYPDLMVGSPLPRELVEIRGSYLRVRLGPAVYPPQRYDAVEEHKEPTERLLPDVVLLRNAPHREAARALLIAWSERHQYTSCAQGAMDATAKPAAEIALSAVGSLLAGQGLGNLADPELAGVSRGGTAAGSWNLTGGGEPQAEVLEARANDRLALVTLRVVAAGDGFGFGVQHPLLVLRKNEKDEWKVLQVTADLDAVQQRDAVSMLEPYALQVDEEKLGKVAGISQASPPDGDNRQPVPELWWDNKGGARLQVVEWQTGMVVYPYESHLYFVDDTHPRDETRVRAAFAEAAGSYRWRVWSVGVGGVLVMSPWRTFHVVP